MPKLGQTINQQLFFGPEGVEPPPGAYSRQDQKEKDEFFVPKKGPRGGVQAESKKKRNVLEPLNLADSPSPSIRRSAEEPSNWRALGETSVKQALADRFTKHPVNPKELTDIQAAETAECDWITVRGQHICVKEGQDKGQAIKVHFEQLGNHHGHDHPDRQDSSKHLQSLTKRVLEDLKDTGPGSRINPINCGNDIERAAKLIAAGKHVTLNQPDQVATLVDKITKEFEDAKARGEKPPVWNLADISVKGTNLFGKLNVNIPRIEMPQFAGTVLPGSKAAELLKSGNKEVDLSNQFIQSLTEKGYKTQETSVRASHLRASQNELDGAKVGMIARAMRQGKVTEARIFITRDNYVLDGHHRWAAMMVNDARNNKLGDVKIPVYKLNTDIGTALSLGKDFQREWGLEEQTVGKHVSGSALQAGGPGSGCQGPNCGRPEGSGSGGSTPRFDHLKAQWAKTNNKLLNYLDKPNSPEAKSLMRKMREISKEMHRVKLGPGSQDGINVPGGPRDMVVVGAGPGGLSTAIMGATDGLDTLFIDAQTQVGGQAKFSSRIENYPGFPVGTSGKQLAQNMHEQATRLGAEAKLGVRVVGLTYDPESGLKTLALSNGEQITARSVVLAGGVEFKKLEFPGSDSKNIVYANGEMLAKLTGNGTAVVLGGSNGAAQAALGVARTASQVYVISRSPIEKGMSDYQVSALKNHQKITVIENDEIAKMWQDEHGHKVETKNGRVVPAKAVGVFIGGAPNTEWLPKEIQRDRGKIVVNGDLETHVPGVFAIGDSRVGSIGRIGAAVGDGQMAERNVFQYFDRVKKKSSDVKGAATKRRPKMSHAEFDALIDQAFDLDEKNPYLSQMVESKPKKLRADGEPTAGNSAYSHIDPMGSFHAPSVKKPKRVPSDSPGETDDTYFDVTKRKKSLGNLKRLAKTQIPGGAPPLIPVRTTGVAMHQQGQMGLYSARQKVRPARGYGQKRTHISFARRGSA
jgi:thioredoxin reductase